MSKCLECGADISQTEGRRPRKFCDNKGKCRLAHWNKNNPKGGKYVLKSTHEAIIEKMNKKMAEMAETNFVSESEAIVRHLQDNGSQVTTKGIIATVAPENTSKHPLWKENDPKEGSMGFYMKYDCYTYEELQKLKK